MPQGSILGPLFFIIYVNDLLDLIDNISLYADDTVIYCSKKTWKEAEKTMNKYLALVNSWYYVNKLSVNTKKTVYITFANRVKSLPNNINIAINNEPLKRVTSVKYLGV